jgi:succinoglycan biosynthesis protein ExoM
MANCYLVAIASYRRPTELQQLLDSFEAGIGEMNAEILVVDNDAEATAREVATSHKLNPVYVVEPKPGIAEARNRALKHFDDRYRAIIFVDDDEWVSPNWLATLAGYAEETGADVAVGPVISIFPKDTPDWVKRGGFAQRPLSATGRRLPTAPTNNTLLLRDAWLRAGSPEFDTSFSETGGSDTDFFIRIRRSGAKLLYCAEAVVYEDVPIDRLSLRWFRRRAIRNGIVDTRTRMKYGGLPTGLARAVVAVGYGTLLLGLGLMTGRGIQSRPFVYIFYGYGRIAAVFNYRVREYARPKYQ